MQLYSVDSKCTQRAVNTASLSELCTPSIKVKIPKKQEMILYTIN